MPVIIPNKINQFQSPARGAAGLRERPAPLRSAPRPGTARGPARPGRYRGRYRGRTGRGQPGPARPSPAQPSPGGRLPGGAAAGARPGAARSSSRCRAGSRYLAPSCSATWGWRQPHAWLKPWLCRLRKGEDALFSTLLSSCKTLRWQFNKLSLPDDYICMQSALDKNKHKPSHPKAVAHPSPLALRQRLGPVRSRSFQMVLKKARGFSLSSQPPTPQCYPPATPCLPAKSTDFFSQYLNLSQ